jgi:hypothetical protein
MAAVGSDDNLNYNTDGFISHKSEFFAIIERVRAYYARLNIDIS